MQDTAPTTPALSRTWQATTDLRPYGENWGTLTHTVTLSRDHVGAPLRAFVDGQAADLARAVGILEGATRTEVLAEDLAPLPAPSIGKARAARLHRLMWRAGVPSGEHYGFAGAALDRPVYSLAALSEEDARQVWGFLAATFPQVRAAA